MSEKSTELQVRHDLKCDSVTLCGIEIDDMPVIDNGGLQISCDCGRKDCEFPTTCPACLQIKSGKVN